MDAGPRSSAHLASLALVLGPTLPSGYLGDEFFPGSFSGPRVEERETLSLPDRVDRLRLHVAVKLDKDGTARLFTGTELVALELTLKFSGGAERTYKLESSRVFDDERPGVPSGPVDIITLGRGQGSYAVHVDAHGPRHRDYASYHLWQ